MRSGTPTLNGINFTHWSQVIYSSYNERHPLCSGTTSPGFQTPGFMEVQVHVFTPVKSFLSPHKPLSNSITSLDFTRLAKTPYWRVRKALGHAAAQSLSEDLEHWGWSHGDTGKTNSFSDWPALPHPSGSASLFSGLSLLRAAALPSGPQPPADARPRPLLFWTN